MRTKEQHITDEQRAYEEWHAEIISDPESREIYEDELQRLRISHNAEEIRAASGTPIVGKNGASEVPHASHPGLALGRKKRRIR